MRLPEDLRARLLAHADPARAAAQQAYLKTDMPMIGVTRPVQVRILREVARERPPADQAAWQADIAALWAGPERDLRYAAIDWLTGFRGRFLDLGAVPLIERMVREGAWWDLVDGIAAHGVGPIVLRQRAEMRPVLLRWIVDPDLWIRRTAILCQLTHRDATDADMLFDFCRRQADDRSFWTRKAIGWALRQHARTDPDAVRAFLATDGHRLSGLSRREANKHLAPVTRAARGHTEVEYLALDSASELKNEFADGEIHAMAGAEPRHNQVAMNVATGLRSRLPLCFVFAGDQRIRTPDGGYFYPDVSVTCGAPEFDARSPRSLVNPEVVIEVLSSTTAAHERGAKLLHLQSIPTLRQFVLIDPAGRLVEAFTWQADGRWTWGRPASGPLIVGDVEIPFAEVFARIDELPA